MTNVARTAAAPTPAATTIAVRPAAPWSPVIPSESAAWSSAGDIVTSIPMTTAPARKAMVSRSNTRSMASDANPEG
jgi:hypothetical protein